MLRTLVSAAVLSSFVIAAPIAQAQVTFDWGGDTTSDSGKQTIKFNHPAKPGDIIVSFSDRKLYFITAPGLADTYPIAIPREQSRWEGVTSVSQKRENPSWTPTPTMLAENPRLPRWVPGGHPMNPLGNRALYLGSSAYRIHGTDAPWTIGTAASKGCVRLFNKDVADLYPRVKMGAKVTVTWKSYGSGKGNELATKAAPDSGAGSDTTASAEKNANSGKHTAGEQSYASVSLFDYNDTEPATSKPVVARPAKAQADVAEQPSRKAVERRKRPPSDSATDATAEPAAAVTAKTTDQPVRASDKPRRAANIETGSVQPKSTAKTASASGSGLATATSASDALNIAVRAEAAALRAADAAERAAAAAERVLQSQAKSVVE